jgi:hypothetical protein
MGHTEQNPNVQRSILASLDQLVASENRPGQRAQTTGLDAQMSQWVAWWQQQSQLQ